jgi:hypothetical protein
MLYNVYFSDDPTYNAKDFHRRYRMNKDMFMKILHVVRAYNDYFMLKKDCQERLVPRQFKNALLQ